MVAYQVVCHNPESLNTLTISKNGKNIVGGASPSALTVIVNTSTSSFPAASVAVQVTIWVPYGTGITGILKSSMLFPPIKFGDDQVIEVTPILSVAVTVGIDTLALPSLSTSVTVMSAGTFTTGGVVSAGSAGTANDTTLV